MFEGYTKLAEMLRRHEGCVLRPYQDTTGNTTIGMGRNLTAKGISQDEADLMLRNDILAARAEAAKYPFFASLNEPRQDVIISMVFNMGSKINLFRGTLACLSNADYQGAAREMLDSRWANQVGNRAKELANIMISGSY